MLTVNPSDHSPREFYKFLIGAIVPRPIAFVSSQDARGLRNLAPFSFFNAVCANPPVICFSTSVREDGKSKDTLNNILATHEFVVNIVSEDFAEQMNICSGEFPPEIDEFQRSGLTPIPSTIVKPPRVLESKIHMECRLLEAIQVSSQPLGGSLVLGRVICLHVAEEVTTDFRIDPDKLRPIGRMGGATYTRTTDRFDMQRPSKEEAKPQLIRKGDQ